MIRQPARLETNEFVCNYYAFLSAYVGGLIVGRNEEMNKERARLFRALE